MVDEEIVVAPYLLREVCTNGSVAAHAVSMWRIRYTDYPSEEVVIEELREAIRACSQPSIFQAEIEKIRVATLRRAEARRTAIERRHAAIAERTKARRETIDEVIATVEKHARRGRKVIASRIELARKRAATDDTRPLAIREIRAALTRDIRWQQEVLRRLHILEIQIQNEVRAHHSEGTPAGRAQGSTEMRQRTEGMPSYSIRHPQRAHKPTENRRRELRATMETLPRPVYRSILKRLSESQDQSRFGLMNAVTSIARDTPDPELKWDLEVVGGAIGSGLIDAQSFGALARSARHERVAHGSSQPVYPRDIKEAERTEGKRKAMVSR